MAHNFNPLGSEVIAKRVAGVAIRCVKIIVFGISLLLRGSIALFRNEGIRFRAPGVWSMLTDRAA